jgi:RNA-binding protein NOB1
LLRKEPEKFDVVDVIECTNFYGKTNTSNKENVKSEDDEGFTEVKSKKKNVKEESFSKDDDEGEWITSDNINEKLKSMGKITNVEKEETSPIKTTIISSDFTVQNLSLKLGIPVMSIDNMLIKKIKHYILKCYSCNNFIFDTSKLFCENCGYNTLMKLGCSINKNGKMKIYDKKAEPRLRGTQVFNIFVIL